MKSIYFVNFFGPSSHYHPRSKLFFIKYILCVETAHPKNT